jgi:hypothetical protein
VQDGRLGPAELRSDVHFPSRYLTLADIYMGIFGDIHEKGCQNPGCGGGGPLRGVSAGTKSVLLCDPSLVRTSYSGDRSAQTRGRLAGFA